MSGWIKLHRQIQDHWLWNKKPFSRGQAWIDLLIMVNHENQKILLGSELIDVGRGERVTSIRKLCKRWGWSNTKTKTFLKLLEDDQMINVKSDSKKTIISIMNYNNYQGYDNDKNDAKATQKHQTNDTEATQKHTNNNDKNEKNDKKNKYSCAFEEFWKEYPRKIEKIGAYKNWQTRLREGYKPEQLITAAKNYAAYCKQNGTEIRYMKHPKTFIGPSKPFEEFLKPIAIAVEQKPKEPKTFWDNDYTFKGERTEKERKVTAKPEKGQEIIIADFDKLIDETLEKMSKPKNKKGDVK